MPQLQTIVLNDGANDHSFAKVREERNNTHVLEAGSGPTATRERFTARAYRNDADSHRTQTKLVIPIMRDIDGVSTKVDENIIEINVRTSPLATASEKQILRGTASAILENAQVAEAIDQSASFY